MDDPKICLLGDRALLVTLSQEISEATNEIVLSACDLIESAQIPGVEEAQPAYSSFCIHFNPSKVSAAWLGAYAKGIIHRLRKAGVTGGEGVYGRETHPDSGVTAAAVKRRLVGSPCSTVAKKGRTWPGVRTSKDAAGRNRAPPRGLSLQGVHDRLFAGISLPGRFGPEHRHAEDSDSPDLCPAGLGGHRRRPDRHIPLAEPGRLAHHRSHSAQAFRPGPKRPVSPSPRGYRALCAGRQASRSLGWSSDPRGQERGAREERPPGRTGLLG